MGVSPPWVTANSFLGEWTASWSFVDSTALGGQYYAHDSMRGQLYFQKDSILKLTVQRCVDGAMDGDTIQYELRWIYDKQMLLLQNEQDEVVLSYRLERQVSDTLYFVLNPLLGKWAARWSYLDSTTLQNEDFARYSMDGWLHFQKDSTVALIAYGCADCIMAKDTVRHGLRWSYNEDTLFLHNKRDQILLTYRLRKQMADTAYFILMKEVELRMVRPHKLFLPMRGVKLRLTRTQRS